jgi:beta-lactamase class A
MRAYLSARGGSVTAAVDDLVSGQMWVYNPGVRHVTASIIKVDILETLLDQAQRRHEWLDGAGAGTVEGMIEESDNDDATSLWDHVGGPGGVGAYNAQVGLGQTSPNFAWGLTTTSAADQIRLLCQLVEPDALLDSQSQDYALSLMQSVDPAQAWGVSGGIPAGVTVALKNGWLPLSSDYDWEINSIGRVKGDKRHYLIAVLTAGESYGYGIDTISGLSGRVWNDLKPG